MLSMQLCCKCRWCLWSCTYTFTILLCSPDTCQLPSLSRLADNVTLALDADLPERIQNGTEIMFACSDGFALTRGRVLTCGDDGIWQGVLPECARKCLIQYFQQYMY